MNRSDAEDAMDACDDSDPFNCGRKIVLRWGKNVKEVVPQGDGVISRIHTDAQQADPATTGAIEARPKTMRVIPPRDLRKNGTRGGAHLTPEELEEFRRLTRRELCAARGPICQAMAFCFEKSAAAKAIADMLKELLLDSAPDVTVDTLIARLYLISDVLYNSQQPGVRNAFLYRDAIERMAPDVFTILGKHGDGKVGRMTLNKLSKAVSTVLSAWTNWSVYNPVFLDELHARFEGREVQQELVAPIKKEEQAEVAIDQGVEQVPVVDTISTTPQGDWTTLTVDEDEDEIGLDEEDEVDGEPINDHEINSAVVKENDQPPVMSPGDASSSYGELPSTRISGQPQVDDDVDGIPLDEGDPDGEPLESDEEVDGEPWDMDDADADGVPLDDEDLD
jgi:U2-associated protein SR140